MTAEIDERVAVTLGAKMNTHMEAHLAEILPRLDPGVRRYVQVLIEGGVETYESCEGGPGHVYPEPTIRFYGDRAAGWHALSVAFAHGCPVQALRRIWMVTDGELTGPTWELVFWHRDGRPQASPSITPP